MRNITGFLGLIELNRDLSSSDTAPVITTEALPPASQGSLYTTSLGFIGGNGPFVWTLEGGSLPNGVSLDANGTLSGTPTVGGSFEGLVFRVTDVDGDFDERTLSLSVASGSVLVLTPLGFVQVR